MDMSTKFHIGIKSLQNEIWIMQPGGIYWLCIEKKEDAYTLCHQVIANQSENTSIALICMTEKSHVQPTRLNNILSLIDPQKKISVYSLPINLKALEWLHEDIMRSHQAANSLLILSIPAEIPYRFNEKALTLFFMNLNTYLKKKNSSLLIICDGVFFSHLEKNLLPHHTNLFGLASLKTHANTTKYHIHWWANEAGITADKLLMLSEIQGEWHAIKNINRNELSTNPDSDDTNSDDAHRYFAVDRVLEGAPALSEHWVLFKNNTELAANLLYIKAATVIFIIDRATPLSTLAKQIYAVRQTRGKAVKIVVRELEACLRYNDEHLLLACGVNVIAPHTESLSHMLTLIDSIQGMLFQRPLVQNLNELLTAIQPLSLKGLLKFPLFHEAVNQIIRNQYLKQDNKGVLVALKPVEGLSPAQSLSLCHFKRNGDLALIYNNQLYLFLSACRINDLNIALKYLFRLPTKEVFINTISWNLDKDIINELERIKSDYIPTEQLLSVDKNILVDRTTIENPHNKDQVPARRCPVATHLILTDEVN